MPNSSTKYGDPVNEAFRDFVLDILGRSLPPRMMELIRKPDYIDKPGVKETLAMTYRNVRPKQYALKVRRGAAVDFVGPYNSIEEAKRVIPESIEIVSFETPERRDYRNREDR